MQLNQIFKNRKKNRSAKKKKKKKNLPSAPVTNVEKASHVYLHPHLLPEHMEYDQHGHLLSEHLEYG